MKTFSCFVLLLFASTAKSQTIKDYIKLLTGDLKQSWRLDSVTMNSNYTEFKKEMVVLFKLNNQAIVFHGRSEKTDTVSWYLEKKERYALISLGDNRHYEIDFLQKNNLKYMRWRDEIPVEKNISINEYFFKPSKL